MKISNDKLQHALVSAVIATLLSLFLPWWDAAIITLIIGIGKEIYDKVSGKGCAEWLDLLADIVGIIIGVL